MDFSNKKSLINVFRLLIKLLAFVGVTRLELATSRPPDAYSNQLSYTPIFLKSDAKVGSFFVASKFFGYN